MVASAALVARLVAFWSGAAGVVDGGDRLREGLLFAAGEWLVAGLALLGNASTW